MGCQHEIAKAIVEQQADYILSVKGNHKELHEPIIDAFRLLTNPKFNKNMKFSSYEHEVSCEHGKLENRIVKAMPINTIFNQLDLSRWANIKSIIQIEHIDHTNNTKEHRYYISSITYYQIERLAVSIRSHWKVENNLHWVLDMVFREDESRIRDEIAAQNMSWMRKMAAFLLKQLPGKISIKNKMIRNCFNPNYMLPCFSLA